MLFAKRSFAAAFLTKLIPPLLVLFVPALLAIPAHTQPPSAASVSAASVSAASPSAASPSAASVSDQPTLNTAGAANTANATLVGPATAVAPESEVSAETAEWFEREVRPLLAEHCLSCHTSGLEEPKANLKLDQRATMVSGGDSGPAIVPGKPEESLLIQAVRGEGLQMPPEKPLSKADQAKLARWIELGAPWPESVSATSADGPDWLVARTQSHWAWQPLRDFASPQALASSDGLWSVGPIDAFILNKLDSLQLSPAPATHASALLRRLTFDLTGLPPSVDQIDKLPANFADASSAASLDANTPYAHLVDELLASPQFGVTWGRHWLDLVRYCETLGHEFDYPIRHAWRYRDAVVDAFNTDTSYAQFVSDHLSGDLNKTPRRHPLTDVNQSLALTGWYWMGEGLHAPVDVWGDEATRMDNQIDVYSKAFMALTISCARCHDHKFDAISAADYTSLVGVLQSSRRTYAYDDPHSTIAVHNRELLTRYQTSLMKAATDYQSHPISTNHLENWIDQVVVKLRGNLEESRKNIPALHPLAPILLLAEANTDQELVAKGEVLRDQLTRAGQAFAQWQEASPLIADFSAGLPDGWYVETPDPASARLATAPLSIIAFDPAGALPKRAGTFSSHALGRQQHMALRSPSFELTQPLVVMRMRGKSAQSSVVVDNYYMNEFQGLLFGDLRKPIDQPLDAGWVVHGGDLQKYIGHPTYISIEDDENGWFELSEARQAQSPPPPQPPKSSLELLNIQDLSAVSLRTAIAAKMQSAWQQSLADNSFASSELPQRAPTGAANTSSARIVATSDTTSNTTSGATSNSTLKASSNIRLDATTDASSAELLRSALNEGSRLQVALPSPDFDRQALETMAQQTPPPTRLLAVHEGTPRDAAVAIRGNPHTRGDLVARSDLEALGGEEFSMSTSSGRSELALSLTSGKHPLMARVMVNRIWLKLFGQGLVDSPDNFGLLGGAPSHPELLDYLALRFTEHDWSVKWLVREICMTQAYRLSSLSSPQQAELDPTARFLSHRAVRRLSAENLRDALLTVSGAMDSKVGGESVRVHLRAEMTGRGRPDASGPLDADGRRSAFIEIRRNFLDPFLVAFDQPPPATTVGKRNASNVPAQALSMLNDPLVHELSNRWSARIAATYPQTAKSNSPSDSLARVRAMFAIAFARQPDEQELEACLAILEGDSSASEASQERLTALAHVLMCAKEFQYLE